MPERHSSLPPHVFMEPLEAAFGNLFCYRLVDADGNRLFLMARLNNIRRIGHGREIAPHDTADAFAIAEQSAASHIDSTLEPYVGDVVCALSYDLCEPLFEPIASNTDHRSVASVAPLGIIANIDTVVVFNETTSMYSFLGVERVLAEEVVASVIENTTGPPPSLPITAPLTTVVRGINTVHYEQQFRQACEHFTNGESYQTVLSVDLEVQPNMSTPEYFRHICQRFHSARYHYWLSCDETRFFGACSLPHVELHHGQLFSRVFAGTMPAASNDAELERIRNEFMNDPKYLSEHIMLVDLERNDLAHAGALGTVSVSQFMSPTVVGSTTYLTSDVTADLRDDATLADVVLGSFPRGVVVGAPKKRTVEILSEIEQRPRGFYSGVIGIYDAGSRTLSSNTIVTCAQERDGILTLHAAGGMTNESTPQQELSELQLKLAYLL